LTKEVVVDFFAHNRVVFVLGVVQDELTQKPGVGHQLAGRLLTEELEVPEQGAAGLCVELNVAKVVLKKIKTMLNR
jgi:hypothetical protein